MYLGALDSMLHYQCSTSPREIEGYVGYCVSSKYICTVCTVDFTTHAYIRTLRTSALLSVYIRMLFMHLMRVSKYDICTRA